MIDHALYKLIFKRKELEEQPRTLINRIKIMLVNRKLKKYVHNFAKTQTQRVYDKTREMCEEIIKANF